MAFRKIDISELSFNPFEKIGKQWMLLTAGNKDSYNTMTASWGQLGVLWNKNVLTCYIRPNRYTYGFVEDNECFTASFLGEEFRNALSFCGSHSGRDCNKAEETGLTPAEIDGSMTFAEAEMVIVCRKLYSYDFKGEGFLTDDGLNEKFFGNDPYHRAYISEIVGVYVKE
ncbi:MAG: flavin reductase [Ruminococcus sp.]|uniref:flavin reductase n=1 Tax=Ruminococcus sp. TaxID=41978 RepID=UPI0025CE0E02|nr:flavin reductase [Ruminococcus sp.]MCR5599779.1 flavin reductase [Ruminococcus sp.]